MHGQGDSVDGKIVFTELEKVRDLSTRRGPGIPTEQMKKSGSGHFGMKLVGLRTVAIDTGILNRLAGDLYSEDPTVKAAARSAVSTLVAQAWIPVLSLDHFVELLAQGDAKVVGNRMALLRSFRTIAWVKAQDPERVLGAVDDVLAEEIRVALESGPADPENLARTVRERIVRFEEPENCAPLALWKELIPDAQAHAERAKQVASFRKADSGVSPEQKVSELEDVPRASAEEVRKLVMEDAAQLGPELATVGDSRLADPSALADWVGEQLDAIVLEINAMEGGSLADAFLAACGLTSGDVSPDATVRDVTRLASFRRQLLRVGSAAGIPADDIWPALRNAKLPSEILISAVRAERDKATKGARATGSDLGDDYLLALAPYVDATVVDKRTYDYLNRVSRRNDNIRRLLGRIVKAVGYTHLVEQLTSADE